MFQRRKKPCTGSSSDTNLLSGVISTKTPRSNRDYRSSLYKRIYKLIGPSSLNSQATLSTPINQNEEPKYNNSTHNEFNNSNLHGGQIFNNNYYYSISSESNSANRLEPCFMVPFSKNRNFIGSDTKLEQFRDTLGTETGHRRLAIHGLGGTGKTQDVLNFVYSYKDSPTHVFWVHGGSKTIFEQEYRKLAKLVKLPGHDDQNLDIRPAVKDWLESPESNDWIIVVDNADNEIDYFGGSDGLEQFIPQGSKGTVIVTTRNYDVAVQLGDGKILTTKEMEADDAKKLFMQSITGASQDFSVDDSSITELLQELQYLPLAIVHVAAYIKMVKLSSPEKYLKMLKQRKLLSKPYKDTRRNNSETILSTFEITFRQLQKQLPLAGYLLNFIGCIDCHSIPHEMLEWCGYDSQSTKDEEKLDEAISKLIGFSLLTSLGDGLSYEMHPLVHLAARNCPEFQALTQTTAKIIAKNIPVPDQNNWRKAWAIYHIHILTLVHNIPKDLDSEHSAVLCFTLSWFLFFSARYPEASYSIARTYQFLTRSRAGFDEDTLVTLNAMVAFTEYDERVVFSHRLVLATEAMAGCKEIFGHEENKYTLTCAGNLAKIYFDEGYLEEAKQRFLELTDLQKRTLGEEHQETSYSLSYIANIYFRQGHLEEAKAQWVKVVEIQKRTLGEDNHLTLSTIYNLLTVCGKIQGAPLPEEATKQYARMVQAKKETQGADHPGTLFVMCKLAMMYSDEGHLEKAKGVYMEVMDQLQKDPYIFPDLDNLTIKQIFMDAGATLISICCQLSDLEEARQLLMQLVKIQIRALSKDHSTTQATINHIKTIWLDQRYQEKAKKQFEERIEIQKRTLGEEHPDTLRTMAELALICYCRQSHPEEAKQRLEESLRIEERVFGKEHPSTLNTMDMLASIYENLGHLEECKALRLQLIEIQKRTLGEKNPTTLNTMADLAKIYRQQGHLEEAKQRYEELLPTKKRIIGEEHLSTVIDIDRLAFICFELDHLDEAAALFVQLREINKKILGEEDPRTLKHEDWLVMTLHRQGYWEEAIKLGLEIVEKSRKILGKEDEDTLRRMRDLAITFAASGDLDTAIDWLAETATIQSRVLGPSHDSTKYCFTILRDFLTRS